MWRDWFYVPRSREYALPWLLGPAVSMVLAIIGLPAGKRPEFAIAWSGVAAYLGAFAAITVLSALVFLTHVRAQYLTWQTARRPFLGTYLVLNVVYLLVYGMVLLLTGQATIDFDNPDIVYTARCLLIGACSILPTFLVSALWKSEEPGVTSARLQRGVALQLLPRLIVENVDRYEYRALVEALGALAKTARSTQTQLMTKTDRALSGLWADAATALHEALRGKAVDDYYGSPIREKLDEFVAAETANLERNQ